MSTYLVICLEIFLKALNQIVQTATRLKLECFPQVKIIILGMQLLHLNSFGLETEKMGLESFKNDH